MRGIATAVVTGVIGCALAIPYGAHAADRNAGRNYPAPGVGVIVRPCGLAAPIVAAVRRSRLDRRWRELEKELEQPLRQVIAAGPLTQEALNSLEQRVLKRHRWTLTRYTVRLLRELDAPDLASARERLMNEAYAEEALSDAQWDGYSSWGIVDLVRGETLEIFRWLEDLRTRRVQPETGPSGEPPGGASLAAQANDVTQRLLEAVQEMEPYMVGSDCRPHPPDEPRLQAGI